MLALKAVEAMRQGTLTALDRCQSHLGPRRATEGHEARVAPLLHRGAGVTQVHRGLQQGHTLPLLRFPPPLPIYPLGSAPLSNAVANEPSATKLRSEHTSELQSHLNLVCRLLLE